MLRDHRINHMIKTVRRLHETAAHEIGEKPFYAVRKAGVTSPKEHVA